MARLKPVIIRPELQQHISKLRFMNIEYYPMYVMKYKVNFEISINTLLLLIKPTVVIKVKEMSIFNRL